MASLVAALVFCPLISALAFNAPEATPVAAGLKLHPQGVTPRPTPAPKFEIRNYKRQNAQLSLIEGPDNVCGYQYGVSSKFRTILAAPIVHGLIISSRWSIENLWQLKMWVCNGNGGDRRSHVLWSHGLPYKMDLVILYSRRNLR